MSPRRRKPENQDLPPNLYTNVVKGIRYYWYEHPITHERADVAALMAHTSEQMTAHYQDDRRVNFVTVRAGLKLG